MVLNRWWSGVRRRMADIGSRLSMMAGRSQGERNVWYLYVEVFWAAILSAAAAFNATFAVRLGATNGMIGWLSSIPALLAVFLYIPAARFLERRAKRSPWIWGSLLLSRLGYGAIIILPWLIPAQSRGMALVCLLIAISMPSTFFATGFNPLLADVIPERDRARVFANRSIISGTVIATLTFLAGKWLDGAEQIVGAAFPLNFQVVYAVGFAGALLSSLYLYKIRVPDSKVLTRIPRAAGVRRSPAEFVANAKAFLAGNRSFVRITANTWVFSFGEWLVGPLYTIFFLRQLHAPDSWIGLNSTLANIGVIVGYVLWRRWIEKLGYARTLRITVPLSAAYAFLVSLFPNLSLILLWGIFINIINPGVNLSHFNILLKLCPDDRRASYIAVYSAIMNAGAFVAPLIGVALSNLFDIRWVLVIGGCIRLIGALLFYIWRVDAPQSNLADSKG